MTTPTLAKFKSWSKTNKPLAQAVCMAKAFAQLERARVDAYIQPLFETFGFVDDEGNKIDNQRHLYRCDDEVMCKAFYAESDAAHRAHGFTGPEGHCPALRAENLLIQAENHLIEAGCELFGINANVVYGDDRQKMLDLLLGACLK
jgi:hypothetical protein